MNDYDELAVGDSVFFNSSEGALVEGLLEKDGNGFKVVSGSTTYSIAYDCGYWSYVGVVDTTPVTEREGIGNEQS
jgi:hypothetical protein